MDFLVLFKDGDKKWVPFSKDIADTQEFETYCRARPELRSILLLEKYAVQERRAIRAGSIVLVKPGDVVYVDLRSWGTAWYSTLTLPHKDTITYVTTCIYGQFCGPKKKPLSQIMANFPDLHEESPVDNLFVTEYGQQFTLHKNYVLIDASFVTKYNLDKQNT